ncbi:MAG TPA: citramalate synthase [Polyangiales bacterium]|nr:citramalate synthase [Polyangiales bacterium]
MSNSGLNGSGPVVEVYDTTLRDGTQMEGMSLSCDDKLRIATHLDSLGVAFIEGGWPGSNPKDVEFFERAKDVEWKRSTLTAFGSTCRAQLRAEDDKQLHTLLLAQTPVCTIFGKSWDMHVTQILRTSLEENLRMVGDSVAFLRDNGRRVIYDAEHFFDGYKSDPEYALETLRAAAGNGAETLVLCDTNGGSMPWEVERIVQAVRAALPEARLGIHAHNDGECGVANSVAAVRAGAHHVQGTINGYGERCGNANLCSIIPDIELKLGLQCLPEGGLSQLYDLAHFVAEIANLSPNDHAAYVGRSAFAHKGGVHVSAIRRHPESYEHVNPSLVGNTSRVVVSELSGRSNVLSKAEELGLEVNTDHGGRVLEKIKELEAKGFAYEAAEASVALLMARQQSGYEPPFEVLDFQAGVGRRRGGGMFAEATVKVQIGDEVVHTAGEGNGPVSALDSALRKALLPSFPEVADIHLSDYKVRILDGHSGTGATTRVLIDSQSAHDTWSTVGASSNIIEASLQALIDSIEYGLTLQRAKDQKRAEEPIARTW